MNAQQMSYYSEVVEQDIIILFDYTPGESGDGFNNPLYLPHELEILDILLIEEVEESNTSMVGWEYLESEFYYELLGKLKN